MKKFKKGAALVLSLAMVMGMTACGSSTSSSAAEATGSEPAASTAENATGTSNGAAIKLGGIGPLTGAAAIYVTQPSTALSWQLRRSTPWAVFSLKSSGKMTSTTPRSPSMPTTT